jgi:hypothetical protein
MNNVFMLIFLCCCGCEGGRIGFAWKEVDKFDPPKSVNRMRLTDVLVAWLQKTNNYDKCTRVRASGAHSYAKCNICTQNCNHQFRLTATGKDNIFTVEEYGEHGSEAQDSLLKNIETYKNWKNWRIARRQMQKDKIPEGHQPTATQFARARYRDKLKAKPNVAPVGDHIAAFQNFVENPPTGLVFGANVPLPNAGDVHLVFTFSCLDNIIKNFIMNNNHVHFVADCTHSTNRQGYLLLQIGIVGIKNDPKGAIKNVCIPFMFGIAVGESEKIYALGFQEIYDWAEEHGCSLQTKTVTVFLDGTGGGLAHAVTSSKAP